MRILIITYVYPPEHAPAGIMLAELAEDLARVGHQVTVLTGFPSHPSGPLFEGWKARWRRQEQTLGGFTLVRCMHSFVPRFRLAGKMWYYFTFAISSFCVGLLLGRCDVLMAQSTPVFGGFTAIVLGKLRRAKIFYWIHDVHPESAINAGLMRRGALSWAMKSVDTWICRRCSTVAVPTEEMRQVILDRGLRPDRVVIQRHWVDAGRIYPSPRHNDWRQRWGIGQDDFVALYAGTVGYISGASIIIEAARLLRQRESILFLFVGDGPLKADLQDQAMQHGLTNVRFLPFQPEADLNAMQAAADVGLVTLKPLSGSTSIPSKMYGYMSAGRAVIASVAPESSVARLIREGGCGWILPPADPEAVAVAIAYAASHPDECRQRGDRAREFFLRELSRTSVTSELCQRLEVLCHRGSSADVRPTVPST